MGMLRGGTCRRLGKSSGPTSSLTHVIGKWSGKSKDIPHFRGRYVGSVDTLSQCKKDFQLHFKKISPNRTTREVEKAWGAHIKPFLRYSNY